MRKEKINGHTIVFHDSIDELPISQFHKYSKYVLVDSGIGSDIASVDAHIGRVLELIGVDDEKAKREMLNLRRSIIMASTEQDTRFKGYLCLVYKVDDKIWEDFSDEGINELYCMCMDEETRKMAEVFGEIKDNLDEELGTYFPQIFSDSMEKNYDVLLRKKALLQLDEIIKDSDHTEELGRINGELARYVKVKDFEDTQENAEVAFDKQFGNMCLMMSKEFGGMVKNYSVMDFYLAYESLAKQNEELKKLKTRRK